MSVILTVYKNAYEFWEAVPVLFGLFGTRPPPGSDEFPQMRSPKERHLATCCRESQDM